MTPIAAEAAAEIPLTSDAEIEARVADLVGRACRRQFWLMFLDPGQRQLPLVMPMEDYPPSPRGGAARLVASRIAELVALMDAASVVVVWERRLGEASTPGEREWARELACECSRADVTVRGQLISHRSGVRWFGEQEYAGTPGAVSS